MTAPPPLKVAPAEKKRFPVIGQLQWKIFLSFSGDIRDEIEKVYDQLLWKGFKQEDIFFDRYTIPPGGNFEKICKYGVANSEMFVAVVNEDYLGKEDPQMEAVYNAKINPKYRTMVFYYSKTKVDITHLQEKVKGKFKHLHKLQSQLLQTRTASINNTTEWAPEVATQITLNYDLIKGSNLPLIPKPEVPTFWRDWMTSEYYNGIDINRDIQFFGTLDEWQKFSGNNCARTIDVPSNPSAKVKVVVLSCATNFDRTSRNVIEAWKTSTDLTLYPIFIDNPADFKDGQFIRCHLGTIKKTSENMEQFYKRARENLFRLQEDSGPQIYKRTAQNALDEEEARGAKRFKTDNGKLQRPMDSYIELVFLENMTDLPATNIYQ